MFPNFLHLGVNSTFAILLFADFNPIFAQNQGLDELISRHQSTILGINTLQLTLRISSEPASPESEETIHYWKKGEEYWLKIKTGIGQESEYFTKNGVTKAINYIPSIKGSVPTKSGRIMPEGGPIYGDPLGLCLFMVPGSKKFLVPLETVANEPHQFLGLRQVSENNWDYSVLSLKHDRARIEVWFSKSHNYLIGKLIVWDTSGSKHPIGMKAVDQFTELQPGIYFPLNITATSFNRKNGNINRTRKLVASKVQINRPLGKDLFLFKFPADLMVLDMVHDKVWRTDAQGELGAEYKNSSGETMTLGKGGLPSFKAERALPNPPSEGTRKTATLEEPNNSTYWILPISLALILCGLGLKAQQTWRNQKLR